LHQELQHVFNSGGRFEMTGRFLEKQTTNLIVFFYFVGQPIEQLISEINCSEICAKTQKNKIPRKFESPRAPSRARQAGDKSVPLYLD
jgi:hypothetical protein